MKLFRRALIVFSLAGLIAGCKLPLLAAYPASNEKIAAAVVEAVPSALPPATKTPFLPAVLWVTATASGTSTSLPSPTPTPTITVTYGPSPTRTPRYSLGDLHVHTTCSDGRNTFDEMVTAAVARAYQFIAITDHRVCDDVIQACINEERLVCFPGVEVASREGLEVLSVGTTGAFPNYLSVAQIAAEVHARGGIAIAAHPWAQSASYSRALLLDTGLDAMECRRYGEQTMPFDIGALPCVYDSDAHSLDVLFDPMVCTGEIRNLDDLRAAIRGGQCVAPY